MVLFSLSLITFYLSSCVAPKGGPKGDNDDQGPSKPRPPRNNTVVDLDKCGCWSQAQRSYIATALKNKLNDFVVKDAYFDFFDTALCQVIGSCFFQNPTSPYGILRKNNLNQSLVTDIVSAVLTGALGDWHILKSEAILWFGCTPPTSTYYAWTSYVLTTFRDQKFNLIFGSLGDSINLFDTVFLDHCSANGAFSRNAAWIFAADSLVVDSIRLALGKVLDLSPTTLAPLNILPFPAGSPEWNFRIGDGPLDDIFSVLLRQALPNNATQWNEYTANPPITVLNLKRKQPTPLPWQLYSLNDFPLTSRLSTNNEWSMGGALQYLLNQVAGSFPPLTQFNSNPIFAAYASRGVNYGLQCYQKLENCEADNPDALYTKIPSTFTLNATSGLIYIGVNDPSLGQSIYSSLTLYNYHQQVGIISVTNKDWQGSAAYWLQNTPFAQQAPNLFVYTFAYNCKSSTLSPLFTKPYCTEIPTSGYPSLPVGVTGNTLGRVYVNPETLTGPDASQLVMPWQLFVSSF